MKNVDTSEKKRRAANMSSAERDLLIDVVGRHGAVDNKRTDAVSLRDKKAAWEVVAAEFNATSVTGVRRDWQQLKHAYDNIKSRTKKALADEKVQRKMTGGGTVTISSVDERVVAALGHRATPLYNPFDSDAAFNDEFDSNLTALTANDWPLNSDFVLPCPLSGRPTAVHVTDNAVSVQSPQPSTSCLMQNLMMPFMTSCTAPLTPAAAMASVPTSTCPSTTSILADLNTVTVITAPAASVPVLSCPGTDTISTVNLTAVTVVPMRTTPALMATSVVPTSSVVDAKVSSHLVERRRVRRRHAEAPTTATSSAADKISSLVDVKSAYYTEKLEMKRRQHDLLVEESKKRMHVLQLKEELLQKQLKKLEE